MAEKCGHCGGYHDATCPRIKSIDYHPDGTIKRVEYIQPLMQQNAQEGGLRPLRLPERRYYTADGHNFNEITNEA